MPEEHDRSLRPLRSADVRVIAAWAGDPGFCQEAEWTADLPVEGHRSFWSDLIEQPPKDLLRLGAVQQATVVGYVDLHGLEAGRRELGYVIGDSARWGHGLGGRAASAGVRHGFRCLELDEIWAEALDANELSVRSLQRLGMQETGRVSDGTFLNEPTFYRQFTISAATWKASLAPVSGTG